MKKDRMVLFRRVAVLLKIAALVLVLFVRVAVLLLKIAVSNKITRNNEKGSHGIVPKGCGFNEDRGSGTVTLWALVMVLFRRTAAALLKIAAIASCALDSMAVRMYVPWAFIKCKYIVNKSTVTLTAPLVIYISSNNASRYS
jgi:hypothetical protein